MNTIPTVLVTVAPYAYFVERIAGGTVHVQTLVPQGMNLHIYEPSPKSVESSSRSVVWFRIEEPFEKKIAAALKERNPSIKFVNLQEGLDLITADDAIGLTPCDGHDHPEGTDLHTWLSVKMALKQAQKIADILIALFPEHKELYQTNFNDLVRDMQKLDKKLTAKLTPFKGDAILVSHPSLGYFCRDYGLIQLSVECDGKDPRPKDVERILQSAENYTIRCALLQQGFNNRGATLIAKKLQLPIYRIDPYARDYLKNMEQLARYIAQ